MSKKEFSYSIYQITNTVTGKCYIGLTCKTVFRRWIEHKSRARCNQAFFKLDNAIRKYGIDCWNINQIFVCADVETAREAEKLLISELDTYEHGYNSSIGGEAYESTRGRHHSEATKRKLSEIHKGKSYHPGKSGSENPMFGKTGEKNHYFGQRHSEATREKMRIAWERRKAKSQQLA